MHSLRYFETQRVNLEYIHFFHFKTRDTTCEIVNTRSFAKHEINRKLIIKSYCAKDIPRHENLME